MIDRSLRPHVRRILVGAAGVLGIGTIGALDYVSGTELRVYPFYWGPVALLAWHFGRRGALGAAVLAVGSWSYVNFFGGLRFSSDVLWAANATVHGGSFLFVGLLISTLRRALTTSRALGRTDPLTAMRNSRAFYEDAAPLLAFCRRSAQPITLAYIDLDNFKVVNDRYGHHAGDALLQSVAEAIRRAVRPSDVCARLGGDEFALMLPGLGERQARAALERVRVVMNQAAASLEIPVTATIGAVTFQRAPAGLEALVQRADALMYAAKADGRNKMQLQVADAPAAAHDLTECRGT